MCAEILCYAREGIIYRAMVEMTDWWAVDFHECFPKRKYNQGRHRRASKDADDRSLSDRAAQEWRNIVWVLSRLIKCFNRANISSIIKVIIEELLWLVRVPQLKAFAAQPQGHSHRCDLDERKAENESLSSHIVDSADGGIPRLMIMLRYRWVNFSSISMTTITKRQRSTHGTYNTSVKQITNVSICSFGLFSDWLSRLEFQRCLCDWL